MLIPPNPHRVALKKLNKACGLKENRPTTLSPDLLREAISSLIKDARIIAENKQGEECTIEFLTKLVEEHSSSFPIVTLSPDYFHDESVPYGVKGTAQGFHHGCIVVRVAQEVAVFDPMAKQLHPAEPDLWLVSLPRARFLNLWDNKLYPKETLWLKPQEGLLHSY